MEHKNRFNSKTANWIAAPLVAVGLIWLVFSFDYALKRGQGADIYRQWVAAQYVRANVSPFSVSVAMHLKHYGELTGPNGKRLKDLDVQGFYDDADTTGIEGVIAAVGPPTTTYPPSALWILARTVGYLPGEWVLPVWLVVNSMFFVLLIAALRNLIRETFQVTIGYLPLLALVLLWPPVQDAFCTSQFTIMVMFFILTSLRLMHKRPWISGLCLTLALLKPSVSLPFLVLPMIKGRWQVLGIMAIIHITLALLLSWEVGEPVVLLHKQWIQTSMYIQQGSYTLRELIIALRWDNTLMGHVVTFGFVLAVIFLCWHKRHASLSALTSLMCFASILWIYHYRYDFTVLLVPLLFLIVSMDNQQRLRNQPLNLILLGAWIILGLALTEYFIAIDHPAKRIVRWLGRLSLIGLSAREAMALIKTHSKSTSANTLAPSFQAGVKPTKVTP